MAAVYTAFPANHVNRAKSCDVPRVQSQAFPCLGKKKKKKKNFVTRTDYLVFLCQMLLAAAVSSRLAFVHKVILVGKKKSRSTWAARILYVKWISLPGPDPDLRSWARRVLVCTETSGLTHSTVLAPNQTSSIDAKILENNTLLCNGKIMIIIALSLGVYLPPDRFTKVFSRQWKKNILFCKTF